MFFSTKKISIREHFTPLIPSIVLTLISIDVDRNQLVAARYKVIGVPTLILFKNGQQAWQQSSVLQKQELASILKSYEI